MDKYIRVKNCNCISDATIEIVEKSLNIKYGSNGTGKSTISEAIYAQANNETDRLKDFKPYNNLKGTIVTIDRKDEEIVFQIQIDKKISDRDIFYTDLKLHDCACEGKSIVEFSVKKRIEKDSDTDYSEQVVPFQIAYAVSIHKAQGLEYKSVKVVITEDVDEQISHNIFYTAITRTTDKLKIYLSKETQKKLATKFVESNVGLKQAQIFAQHAGLKLKNKLSS